MALTLLHAVRLALRRAGVDISRYPQGTMEHRRAQLLRHFDVSVVLDVGANEGQYATQLRALGYNRRIVSFEPLRAAVQVLSQRAGKDGQWTAVHSAIGAAAGTARLNVAGNSVSSSLLPMLERHVTAAPTSQYMRSEDVAVAALADAAMPFLEPTDRVYVKVDVQGYQHEVLRGAKGIEDLVVGLEVEFSLVPLYEGEMLFSEGLALLTGQGFALMGVVPGFADPATGRTLQVDAIFFREPD